MTAQWTATHHLQALTAADLARPGIVFHTHHHLYRTTGRHLASGGMGTVHIMERVGADGRVEDVVGKTFHAQFHHHLTTDPQARREHEQTLGAVSRIAALEHPGLLPTYISAPIADNHLFVTPLMGDTLLEAIRRGNPTPRRRIELLCDALEGLALLHRHRLVHRDLTLRNIVLDRHGAHAILFDFDLALCLTDVGTPTYRDFYKGRIFGSPGYSVAPEVVDPVLNAQRLSPRLDIFAIGGALFSLFTTRLPYGDTQDMWGLLMNIAEGLVFRGQSRITYPDGVPHEVRGVIERCLEREAEDRYPSVEAVLDDLRTVVIPRLEGVLAARPSMRLSVPVATQADPDDRLRAILANLPDAAVSPQTVRATDQTLQRHGYLIERGLGRVRGHAIFLAHPDRALIAAGRFPDDNTYPKIVTAINLAAVADPRRLVELWLGVFLPKLTAARQGLTSLYRAIADEATGHLFLLSEYIAEPRFGAKLASEDLSVDEALGLGFLVARQVFQLHERGIAHNNVTPGALLFRGDADTRLVYPSMIGLVEPSLEPAAMEQDVRSIAEMTSLWIRPQRVESLPAAVRARVDRLRMQLVAIAYKDDQRPPSVEAVAALISDVISALDYNFSVLRDAGGDLVEYLRLVVSHRMYSRLWP